MAVNRRTVAVAALALLVWAGCLSALWRPGWRALSWDDFARVELGQEWAARPFIGAGDLVWLPLQSWVYGIAFRLTGTRFDDNPMLLAALVNSAATAAAAALVGRAAWLLFGSAAGGLVAFVVVLFSPWVVFISLSGLSEALYYLAIAAVTWALAARQRGGGLATVALGSLGIAAAAAVRYEGWLLVPAWLAVVAATLPPPGWTRPSVLGGALWRGRAVLMMAAVPGLVPAGWMALNAHRRGGALAFRHGTAAMFEQFGGWQLFAGVADRLAYYPSGLVRSAPLLLPLLLVLAVVGLRHAPRSRLLIGLVSLHCGLFYLTSLQAGVGLFTERFMFAFALGLAPLLGMLPGLLTRVRPRGARAALVLLLAMLLLAQTAHGLSRPPEEWTHAPDLIETSTLLGRWARTRSTPLRVGHGDGFDQDLVPLRVQNGRRVMLVPSASGRLDRPPGEVDVWIERLPARIRALPAVPTAIIGRYHLYGTVPIAPDDQALGEWRRVDENGVATTLRPIRFVGLELTGDDPPPGAEAFIERLVPQRDRLQRGSLALRWMYGHGVNLGRLAVEVRVDGRTIFRTDLGTPSRWHTVRFEIPSGAGASALTLVVRASNRIERTWLWGRHSTVIVKDVEISSR